jgi:radical SAM superfamily enzyme YgiQ (UPF0313 family)
MYISSILKQAGHDVKVLNYNLQEYVFVSEVKGCDVVMFTGFEAFTQSILFHANKCKELGIKTIIGGALATFKPEFIVKYIDTVIIGEGENIVLDALTKDGVMYGTKARLSELPYPDYDGFNFEEYNKRHSVSYIGILTSRGCPYRCTFCAQTCVYQERDLEDVFKEIDFYIGKYGINNISFNDNNINLSKNRYIEICKGMKQRNLEWGGAIRCNIFDDDMAVATKESGCVHLVVGVESFNQNKLDYINKHATVKQITDTLNLLNKYNISYHGNILIGFENETYSDIANEISHITLQYKVFPTMVQGFIGTSNGKKRLISKLEEDFLNSAFTDYAQNSNLSYNLEEATC